MDPTGHYLVLDREEAFYFSSRTKTHLAFQLSVPIAGRVSTPSKKDFFFPSLGWVEGKLKLFWIEPGKGLWMTDLDLSNPKKPKIPSRAAWVRLTGAWESEPRPDQGDQSPWFFREVRTFLFSFDSPEVSLVPGCIGNRPNFSLRPQSFALERVEDPHSGCFLSAEPGRFHLHQYRLARPEIGRGGRFRGSNREGREGGRQAKAHERGDSIHEGKASRS